MNYGSMGGLDLSNTGEDYEFYFKREVYGAFTLSGGSILQDNSHIAHRNGSILHGLYYPCPDHTEDKSYKNVTLKHDFLLTPIPRRLWKASARLHVFLKNDQGKLNAICAYLKDQNISIVHSESSRSSFRYSTWSAHIVFEHLLDLDRKQLEFDKDNSYYKQTKHETENVFLPKFLEANKAHLFEHSPVSVNARSNYTLAYFDNYIEQNGNEDYLFTLTVNDPDKSHRKRCMKADERFKSIIGKINTPNIVPASTFSEIDTRELNIRTTLIPNEDSKRFFKALFTYTGKEKTAAGKKLDTYVGVIHSITDCLPPQYNIWHSYDRTIGDNPETGEISLLIEDTSQFFMAKALEQSGIEDHRIKNDPTWNKDNRDGESYQNEALKHFEAIKNLYANKPEINFQFAQPIVYPIPTAGVMKEIIIEESKGGLFEFDLFISYSRKNEEFVRDVLEPAFLKEGIDYHLDYKEIESGDRLDDALMYNIEKSREMCVLVSEESANSSWMAIERGAAWILRKRITGIKMTQKVNMPEILPSTLWLEGFNEQALSKYAKEVIHRRNQYLGRKYNRNFFK